MAIQDIEDPNQRDEQLKQYREEQAKCDCGLNEALTKAESGHISDVRISLERYHQTLKSIDSRVDGAKNADSVNERIWHLNLARKMIRDELYMYPLPSESEA